MLLFTFAQKSSHVTSDIYDYAYVYARRYDV